MPTVNVTSETFEALQRVAARKRLPLEAAAEEALRRFVLEEQSDGAYQREWDELLADIRSKVPEGKTPSDIERDVDAAIEEVRAERRARGH